MPQEYDTTGKDILNEQINEIARFVLNVVEIEVLADLDTDERHIALWPLPLRESRP